ncbi:MAG: thrombospondin type 3 repeat-containing protein, partial [Polyangiales bacterium]
HVEARDVRLGAEYAIIPFARVLAPHGIGLLARLDVSLPTGDQDNFGGDRGLVLSPTIALEERLGRFAFGAAIGARLRQTTTLLAGSPGSLSVGSQGSLSLGAALDLDGQRTWSVTAEGWMLAALTSNGASPIQGLAGVRWAPLWAGDFSMHAGFGGGFRPGTNAQLLEPVWRGTLDLRFAPIARDTDGDGIADKYDLCPNEPEDKDGFQDADGCPDPGNDNDGVADKVDKCPDVAAGPHGIDGCPDPDTDGDGIPDRLDKCPDKPEDLNGYEDTDGCPEGGPPKLPQTRCADGSLSAPGGTCDSDKDGLTDDVDVCPLEAEDKDGIVDEDGCPELDADEDGIGDQLDKCPLEAETIDGKADGDGCPEPGAHDHVVYAAGAIEIPLADKPISFAAGSAVVSPAMRAQVRMIAQRAQGLADRGVKEIVVDGWADRAVDTPASRDLAMKRAEALKASLVAADIPAGLVVARVGDFAEARKKGEPSYLVTVRTKRKTALGVGKAKVTAVPQ